MNMEERKKFVESYEFTPATLQTFKKLSGIDPNSSKGKSIQEALKQYYLLHVTKESDELIGMPSQEIDHLWHAHILDTQEYHDFCQKAFRSYLHHIPFVKGQDIKKEQKANEVLVKRAKEEGYDTLLDWLPAAIIASILLDSNTAHAETNSSESGLTDTHTSDSFSLDSSSFGDSSTSSCGGSSCGGGCGA